jgi:DNA-directed RNA polymerase subunit delta
VDEWEKPEEDDSWDPDFEEFDLPKSKTKKATGTGGTGGKKAGKGNEDDLSMEEDFKDMDLFNDSAGGGDDEDDDY